MYGYYEKDNTPTLEQLLTYYRNNTQKISELNYYNDTIKTKTTQIVRSTDLYPYAPTKDSIYKQANQYLKKELKRGDEGWKEARIEYNYLLKYILQEYISPSIESIKEIIWRYGNDYNQIAYELHFMLNDTEYDLSIPILENISVKDLWGDYGFSNYCAKYILFKATSPHCWETVWSGTDLTKLKDEYTFESEDK